MPFDAPSAGGPQATARWPSSPLATSPAITPTQRGPTAADNIWDTPLRHHKGAGKENSNPNDRGRSRNVSPTKALLAKAMGAARAASPERRSKKEATDGKASRGKAKSIEDDNALSDGEIAARFANLLTDLQVAPEQRKKLLAMDVGVKSAMLKGSSTLNLSSFGLESPKKARAPLPQVGPHDDKSWGAPGAAPTGLWRQGSAEDVFSGVPPSSPNGGSSSPRKGRSRAASLVGGSGSREAALASLASDSAVSLATLLKTTCAAKLDISRTKRLRAVISSESPTWIDEFADEGGIRALLARLKELLDMEWREEQHDDMLLHEILRCSIALTNTDRGKFELATAQPSPFVDLAALLFSEKKPGDLTTRKYLVDLLALVMDMPVANVLSSADDSVQRSRQLSSCWTAASSCRPAPGLLLLLCLLHNPRSPEKESVVDFITASHNPRPFKTYVVELGGICRDYFWVFCHAKNRYWDLRQVDVKAVEGPKVPGGMTGGVEFEAMAYLTSNLRLINKVGAALLAGAGKSPASSAALDFHQLLFASGLERVLATLRRASQGYYAPLHLELARYMDLATRSGFALPANLAVWRSGGQALPPAAVGATSNVKTVAKEPPAAPSSPSKVEDRNCAASPQRKEQPSRPEEPPRPLSRYEAMRQAQKALELAKQVSSPPAPSPAPQPTPVEPRPAPALTHEASMLPSPSLSFPSEPDLSFHFSLGTFSTAERAQLHGEEKGSSADAWTSSAPQRQAQPPSTATTQAHLTAAAAPSSPRVSPRLAIPSLPVAAPSSPLLPAWRHADLGVRGASSSTGASQGSIVGTAVKAWESRGRQGSGESRGGLSPAFGPTRRA